MRVYFDEDFETFPKTSAYPATIFPPAGDYSRVKVVPECCIFDFPVTFGMGVRVGCNCEFRQPVSFGRFSEIGLGATFRKEASFGAGCRLTMPAFTDMASFGEKCVLYGPTFWCVPAHVHNSVRLTMRGSGSIRDENGIWYRLQRGFPFNKSIHFGGNIIVTTVGHVLLLKQSVWEGEPPSLYKQQRGEDPFPTLEYGYRCGKEPIRMEVENAMLSRIWREDG